MEILSTLSEEEREGLFYMHRTGELKAFLKLSNEKPKVFDYLLRKAIETQSYDLLWSYI